MGQFEGNRDLPDLLRDAVRPARAIAFERLFGTDALHAHAELGEAFKIMHRAEQYFKEKLPSDTAQHEALLAVHQQIQEKLNQGKPRISDLLTSHTRRSIKMRGSLEKGVQQQGETPTPEK